MGIGCLRVAVVESSVVGVSTGAVGGGAAAAREGGRAVEGGGEVCVEQEEGSGQLIVDLHRLGIAAGVVSGAVGSGSQGERESEGETLQGESESEGETLAGKGETLAGNNATLRAMAVGVDEREEGWRREEGLGYGGDE